MTELALASWDEIQAEITKRFPMWAYVIVHPVDGNSGQMGTRSSWGFNGDHAMLVGKVELLKLSIASQILQQQKSVRPDHGLDDQVPPPQTF
jgi:hypothetical protein